MFENIWFRIFMCAGGRPGKGFPPKGDYHRRFKQWSAKPHWTGNDVHLNMA